MKNVGQVANSVDPDQMLHVAASDLGLHVCSSLPVSALRLNMVISIQNPRLAN